MTIPRAEFTIQPPSAFIPDSAGAWSGIEMERYHTLPGESNSRLTMLEACPQRYRLTLDGKLPAREETHDMTLGTMLHGIVNENSKPTFHLQPETYPSDEGPKKWTMAAKFCKAWVAEHADLPVLDKSDAEMLSAVGECVKGNKFAQRLMRGATPEVMACARNNNLELPYMLRVRYDMLGRDDLGWYFVEVKSCRDASTDAFAREVYKRRYHVAAAQYRRVLQILTGETARCYLIALEKNRELPRVNVRQLTGTAMDIGDSILDERLKLLKRCRLANVWPAFSDDEGSEHIQMIDLPEFAYGDDDLEITASPTE